MVTTDFPPNPPGGVCGYVVRSSKALTDIGCRVSVLTSIPDPEGAALVPAGVEVSRGAFSLPEYNSATDRMSPCPYSLLQESVGLVAGLAEVKDRGSVDVVHAQDVFSVVPGGVVADLLNVPLVLTKHINPLRTYSVDGFDASELQNFRYFEAVERWMLDRADAVIAVSDTAAQAAARSGRTFVVHPAGLEAADAGHVIEGRQSGPPSVLLPGRLDLAKGPDIAVRALGLVQHGDVRLLLTGDGPLREELLKLAQDLGVEPRVEFVGHQDEAGMEALYRAADLVVAPSRREAYGMVVVEAMKLGCMVIGSRVGGISGQIEDGENGLLIEPEDPEALARAIDTCLDDPELVSACRKGALRSTAGARSWEDVARETLAVYEAALPA